MFIAAGSTPEIEPPIGHDTPILDIQDQEQKVSVETAIRIWTLGNAYAAL